MKRKQLFEKFLIENIDHSFRFAYLYVHNQQDAEDVVSESVIKALKSIHTLKREEAMKPWFFKIIVHTSLNLLRQNKKVIAIDTNGPFQNSHQHIDDYDTLSFGDLIKNLPPLYRSIIALRFFEDMKLSDIARVLSINENTVKTRLYKALDMLKIDLKGEIS